MQKVKYNLTIPLVNFDDEVEMITKETNKFCNSNSNCRVNSLGYEELSRENGNVSFEITVEFEPHLSKLEQAQLEAEEYINGIK